MVCHLNNKPAQRQLISAQVNPATGADGHGWRPPPTEAFDVLTLKYTSLFSWNDEAVYRITPAIRCRAARAPSKGAQVIVNFAVRLAGCERDSAAYTVTGLALEPGGSSSTVIVDPRGSLADRCCNLLFGFSRDI